MKKILSVMLSLTLLLCSYSVVQAAELLDVKPIVTGSSASIVVTADIAMTYTYYKIPGEARAVVDIAEADPEKVEPLIVVNKGAISSISVDKAQISGMVVSRLVFNLVAEADIFVESSPDRKLLTVTFGGLSKGATSISQPGPAQPFSEKTNVEPVKEVVTEQSVAAAAESSKEDDDPLGLDETDASSQKKLTIDSANAGGTSPVSKEPRLKPVVPISSGSYATAIRKIELDDKGIDIQANGQVADFKLLRLSKPERLVIDIPGVKKTLIGKVVVIDKFGISKVRIGLYPGYVRIVLDASSSVFPEQTVTNTPDGLRINFK